MEANKIAISETVPASRKLQADDAKTLLQSATTLIVMKGKQVSEFKLQGTASSEGISSEAIAAMLGPTGNLRAPTIRIGKRLLVGFNEDVFRAQW